MIKKRGKQRYLVRIYLGRDGSGKRTFLNKTIRGQLEDAQKYERDKKRELDLGLPPTPPRMTVEQYGKMWLEFVSKFVRKITLQFYEDQFKRYINPALGNVRLSALQPLHVQALETGMLERALAPDTVRKCHTILSSALSQAVRWRIIHLNPVDSVKPPPKKRKREMRVFNEQEAKAFLEAARDTRMYACFVLALFTGMRPEEYLGLAWSRLDLENRVVTVERTVVMEKKGGGWYFSQPKTKRSWRTIKFPPWVATVLKQHHRQQAEEKLKAGKWYEKDHDLVFATQLGRPLKSNDLNYEYFKPLCVSIGIHGVSPYLLRHSYATLSLAAGEDIKVVSDNMGHASSSFTMDTYCQVLPSMKQRSSDRLEKLLVSQG